MSYLEDIKSRFNGFGFKQQEYLFVSEENSEEEEEEDEEDEDSDTFEENYFG